MIVPMKKVFLLVQNKDMATTLGALQQMGLLHVAHERPPSGTTLNELNEKAQRLLRVIDILSLQKQKAEPADCADWGAEVHNVLHLAERIQHIKDDMGKRRTLAEAWEPWGDFDPRDIMDLREKGIFVRFVEIPKGEKIDIPEEVKWEVIASKGSIVRALAVSEGDVSLPVHDLALPPVGLKHLKEQLAQGKVAISDLEKKMAEATRYLDAFRKAFEEVRQQMTFQEVFQGRGQAESFSYLKGFVPKDRCRELEDKARKEEWGLVITDTEEGDQVPTLLRNPRWVEIINPVFKLIDVLPGYKEFDISLFFLFFFSVFFGMLIGDAGYGFVFILLTMFLQNKFKHKAANQAPFILLYALSGCAVLWGILSGTYFGQEWLAITPLKPLLPWLRENSNVQLLCFFIGAVHLSIAHIWRIIVRMPSLTVLGELGWLLVVWGMYHVAKLLILGLAFPVYAKWLFIGGGLLILFFTSPQKNILKAMGAGVGDFLLRIANTFADVVSYIRLFAVGLASVAVADAFNAVASDIGFNSVLAGFMSALVLLFGHIFNIVLGSMSILVHGLRLNVLEFSSHLNMEWSGVRYNPFQKTKDN